MVIMPLVILELVGKKPSVAGILLFNWINVG